ncbi:MAG: hypothetical protein GQ569_11080, partial [Methylococcaceae bacterium]|nr:hypothetical protein [Methylococcaceae bacterium]
GESFFYNNGVWKGDADTDLILTEDNNSYILTNTQGAVERYDLEGRLISKTDLNDKQTLYSA